MNDLIKALNDVMRTNGIYDTAVAKTPAGAMLDTFLELGARIRVLIQPTAPPAATPGDSASLSRTPRVDAILRKWPRSADFEERGAELEHLAKVMENELHSFRVANAEHWEIREQSDARIAELERESAGLREDKKRLDWLDAMNLRLNERYQTDYGWNVIMSHNVTRLFTGTLHAGFVGDIDLMDAQGGHRKVASCRDALDRAIRATEALENKSALAGGEEGKQP